VADSAGRPCLSRRLSDSFCHMRSSCYTPKKVCCGSKHPHRIPAISLLMPLHPTNAYAVQYGVMSSTGELRGKGLRSGSVLTHCDINLYLCTTSNYTCLGKMMSRMPRTMIAGCAVWIHCEYKAIERFETGTISLSPLHFRFPFLKGFLPAGSPSFSFLRFRSLSFADLRAAFVSYLNVFGFAFVVFF